MRWWEWILIAVVAVGWRVFMRWCYGLARGRDPFEDWNRREGRKDWRG